MPIDNNGFNIEKLRELFADLFYRREQQWKRKQIILKQLNQLDMPEENKKRAKRAKPVENLLNKEVGQNMPQPVNDPFWNAFDEEVRLKEEDLKDRAKKAEEKVAQIMWGPAKKAAREPEHFGKKALMEEKQILERFIPSPYKPELSDNEAIIDIDKLAAKLTEDTCIAQIAGFTLDVYQEEYNDIYDKYYALILTFKK